MEVLVLFLPHTDPVILILEVPLTPQDRIIPLLIAILLQLHLQENINTILTVMVGVEHIIPQGGGAEGGVDIRKVFYDTYFWLNRNLFFVIGYCILLTFHGIFNICFYCWAISAHTHTHTHTLTYLQVVYLLSFFLIITLVVMGNICKHFISHGCRLGNNCRFLHVTPEELNGSSDSGELGGGVEEKLISSEQRT